MKRAIRKLLEGGVSTAIGIGGGNRAGAFVLDQFLRGAMQRTKHVVHAGTELRFAAPNALAEARAATFSSKEPETLEWIDGLEAGSVLWDIGANVGLYSCYAAKTRDCRVFAFEPSVFNVELLARNVFLNGLVDRVTLVPLALSERLTTSTLNMTMTEWGGAMSTFSESYTHDGTPMRKVFEFRTIGLSMDECVTLLKIDAPHYIKMDVDGIEHLILAGGRSVLAAVRGVLVEVNDEFAAQSEGAEKYLREAGLTLLAKRHSEMFGETRVFNQIWTRAEAA